jgi:phage-related protein
MGTIENTLAAAGGLFGNELKALANGINDTAQTIGKWIEANPKLASTIGMVVVGLTGFFAAVGTLGLVGGTIIAGLGMLGGALAVLLGPIGLVAGAFAGAAYLIMDNWEAVESFFAAFGLAFRGGLAPLEPILNGVRAAWTSLVNWIGGGSSAVSGWLSGSAITAMVTWGAQLGALAKQAVGVLANILGGIGSAAQAAWAALSPALGPMMAAFRGLGTALQSLWATVAPLLGSLFGALGGVGGLSPLWSAFGSLVGGVARAIIQAITGMVGIIAGIVGTIASVIGAVVAVFNGGSGQIGEALRAIPRAVIAAFDGLPGQMLKLGGDIIAGLARGILGAAGQAVEALGGVASGLVGKFTGLLGIKSPSRVFAGFGENVMQGLGRGIDGSLGAVLGQMGAAGGALARTGAAALASASVAMAPPAMASPGGGGMGGGGMNVTIHIHISAPSGDPSAIAQAVRGAAPDLARQLGSLTSRQARVAY